METPLRIGTLAAPEMLTGPQARRRELLSRASDAGITHVFMADHVSFHTGLGMDGLIQAATAAALHETLEVYVGVYLLALRHPVPVARQLAQLCESAPGRLVLGVGVGGEDRHEIEVCGVDPRTRGRRTDECLEALGGLLRGVPTTLRGAFIEFEDAHIVPAPDPPIPLVVGGRADAALRRAGRFGDGWLAAWTSPRRFAASLERAEQHATEAGRAGALVRNGLQLWVGVDRDRSAARERLAHEMQEMYRIPFEPFEKYAPHGDVDEIADAMAPYIEAGCREFNVMAVADGIEARIDAVAAIRERLMR